MMDGWISEWGSTGQPYMLFHYEDQDAATAWQEVCVTNTDVIEQDYGTPEMLERYGNAYTAAAVELYAKFLAESQVTGDLGMAEMTKKQQTKCLAICCHP